MTQPSDSFETYDAVGNREHLIDMIYALDTAETPLLSAIQRVSTGSTKHEWQTDDLGSAGTNYVVEGDEAVTDASVATVRLDNYTQILDKVAIVTGTQEVVKKAGRASEMAYQLAKRAKQLKKDLEFALLDNNAKVAGSGNGGAAREMGGIPAYVKTNHDKNTATMGAVGGAAAVTPGTAIALTEGRLKNVIQQAWAQGGNPDMVLCTAFNKQVISSFSGNGTRFIEADAKKLMTAYDIYASDFGELKVVPCRHGETDMVYVLDTSMLKLATLRDFQVNDIASTGDFQKKQILIEATLEVCNEKAHGLIVDVTNA
jgi:hypothetical protein